MKPHGIENQLAMLVLAAIAFGVGRGVQAVVRMTTGYAPQTRFGELLWGIVPAVPFVLAFFVLVVLAILMRGDK